MKKVYVALITPFDKDGEVDFNALKKIVLMLIDKGCDGFVVCGTTAESATLSDDEKFKILSLVCDLCANTKDIYFGCGSNNTLETLKMARMAQNYPIRGIMLVTPYYNKPTQKGLYAHYACVAQNCNLPIMLYEVENRCGIAFEIETIKKLVSDYKNIFSIKIASKNLNKVKRICNEIKGIEVFCGNDDLIKEYDLLGASGIISVIGHIEMEKLIAFYKYNIDHDFYFKKLSEAIFYETNPVGIKYALKKIYNINDLMRLPLVGIDEIHKEKIDAFFDKIID